jgi:hypothetical protein
MSFPTTQVSTDNLDAATDDPSLARADLYQSVVNLNAIVAGAGAASGVALLDTSGRLASTKLPQSITYTNGNQIINPSTKIVNIQDIVRLTAQTKSDILAINTGTLTRGDISFSSDGNSGTVAICLYDGSKWLRIHAQTPLNSTTPVISTANVSTGTGSGTFVLSVGTITTLSAGASATVTVDETEGGYTLNFGIPQGAKGDTGDKGDGGGIGLTDDVGNSLLDGTNFNGVVNNGVSLADISGSGKVVIDTWSLDSFHSAKYFVTVKDGSSYHVSEIMVLSNGTDVFINEYGVLTSDGSLGVFTADKDSSLIKVSFTPTGASNMAIMASITKMAI